MKTARRSGYNSGEVNRPITPLSPLHLAIRDIKVPFINKLANKSCDLDPGPAWLAKYCIDEFLLPILLLATS